MMMDIDWDEATKEQHIKNLVDYANGDSYQRSVEWAVAELEVQLVEINYLKCGIAETLESEIKSLRQQLAEQPQVNEAVNEREAFEKLRGSSPYINALLEVGKRFKPLEQYEGGTALGELIAIVWQARGKLAPPQVNERLEAALLKIGPHHSLTDEVLASKPKQLYENTVLMNTDKIEKG